MATITVNLSSDNAAAVVPRLDPCWSNFCWAVFVLGMLAVLWGIAAVGKLVPTTDTIRIVLVVVLFAALTLASVNTYWASRRFKARGDVLLGWLKECLELASVDKTPRTFQVSGQTQKDLGYLELTLGARPVNQWRVRASGAYRPEPFRTDGVLFPGEWTHAEYVERIRAETNAARIAAARAAAALGFVFVAAIQVFGKLPC